MPYPVDLLGADPGDEIFETKVRPLLAEAYDMPVSKYNKQAANKAGDFNRRSAINLMRIRDFNRPRLLIVRPPVLCPPSLIYG